ncbi:ATP-dependent helicase [Kineococcus sp. NUM-3379]
MRLQHTGAPAASVPRVPRLRRRAGTPATAVEPDPTQRQVVGARTGSGPLVVLSAPGTGATTTLVEAVAARVERDGIDPDRVLVLAPSRRAAGRLRDRITDRLRRTMAEPAARTPQSYAFGLLRRVRAAAGEAPPRLITGAEQDLVLADLLRGHQEGADPGWPEDVPREAWTLRTFRTELRDLVMRATERDVPPAELAELGRRHARPEWVAAARTMQEYLDVNALGRADGYDPAGVVTEATAHLQESAELLRAERERWALVAVDDAHDVSEAGFRLLDELCGGGRDLLLFADPDAVTEGFRGADARTVALLPERYRRADGRPAPTVVLSTSWRQPPALRAATGRVAVRIGAVGGGGHRAPVQPASRPQGAPGAVGAVVLSSRTQEAAWVAQRLRARHLLHGVPWEEMAVLVRSGGSTEALRRGLATAGVPVTVPLAELPVRDEPAVRPLCTALRAVLQPQSLTAETARELVTSPLGGADVVGLRRLRQALRREERAGGGTRSSDVVLAAVLADPVGLVALPDPALRPAHRVAAVLQAGRAAAAARGASAETVLWAMWEAGGLGPRWQRTALAGGRDGARADRDLDAVVALFEAAGRFVDRFPGSGSALRFLDQLQAEEVPTDTLAERAPGTGAVTLTTAQGAVGREWDVVVVAGVQEGAWPDLRLRGSVLGSQALVDLLAGRDADGPGARRAVLEDELRLFHVAVSRARRELVVTSVRTEDERPSPFLDLVDPRGGDEEGERPLAEVPRAVSLPALVARLRQVVCAPAEVEPPVRRAAAAAVLARLADAGVPGADPDDWYGVPSLSDPRPLREAGEQVDVSPSRVGLFEQCPLRWLLESVGGTGADSGGQSLGSLVHAVAAEAPDAGAHELRARLDERWPELGFAPGWISDAARRRADRMLVKLADYTRTAAAQGRELVAVEQDFTVAVGRARLRGRVDRLERDADGRPVVVDLKTGAAKPRRDELARNAQLGVYQLAAEQGGFEGQPAATGGAALVQLGTAEKSVAVQAQAPLGEDPEPHWVHDLLERTAEGMAADRFDAVAGPHCRTCPVRSSCPVQEEGRSVLDGEGGAP